MSWNFEGQQSQGTGIARDFVVEGNIELYLIKQEQDRIRFLIAPYDVEEIAAANKITPDEAQELVTTKLVWDEWYMPVRFWQHRIPPIAGQRLFGTQFCLGMSSCPLCDQNQVVKDQGVSENKLLPFPVRLRYIAPIWSYRLKKVLYLSQNQDFFEEINAYIEKNGLNVDFDIWKTGRGLNTKYHSIFLGKAERSLAQIKPKLIAPKDISWTDPEGLAKKLGQAVPESANPTDTESPTEVASQDTETTTTTQETSTPEDAGAATSEVDAQVREETGSEAGAFVVPFGSHKGKSLQELFDAGHLEYITFLATKSAGAAQENAAAFLKEQGAA